jgi:predicted phage terminase large subunit-like protein
VILTRSLPRTSCLRSLSSFCRGEAKRRTFTHRGNLLDWGKYFFPERLELPFGKHHREMATRLQSLRHERGVRTNFIAPRGGAKTELATFLYPINCVCEGTESYIGLLGETHKLALKYLASIKDELEHNRELAEIYPDACGVGRKWTEELIVTKSGIAIEALGTGDSIRGSKELGRRFSLLVADDLDGDEAAFSKTTREHTRDWAMKGAFKAGRTKTTNIVSVGTTVHKQCLVMHLAGMPGWHTYSYQSIIKWPDEKLGLWVKWENILRDASEPSMEKREANALEFFKAHEERMRKGAVLLWEENENLYDLMFLRAADGHNAFEQEKQNRPVDPAKCEWAAELFEDRWFDTYPEDIICRVAALDPSKGKADKSGDFQAMCFLAVDSHMNLYLDYDMSRRPVPDMVNEFVMQGSQFGAQVGVVEDDQFQELIIPECEDAAIANKLLFPIEGISHGGVNKNRRIMRVGPYVNRGRVFFKRRSPGVLEALEQFQEFPNGDFDDGPDATEMAVRKATEMLGSGDGTTENPY